MADASRCPACRAKVHPYAAACPTCGADLDAYRRRRGPSPRPRVRLQIPRVGADRIDFLVMAVILLAFALFFPLFGLLLALFIAWHGQHNGLVARRNVAAVCAALALLNIIAPSLIGPHLII